MLKFSRRQFLKAAGITGIAALLDGCSDTPRKLIPFITAPEDILPGEATWYATTCRECPAGCGMLAKNCDGRVVKVEGNPLHPVNRGKICARGQASVQGIYNPDRYKSPMLRDINGKLSAISWEQAEKILLEKMSALNSMKVTERAVFLTDLRTGVECDLIARWLRAISSTQHIVYEPFAYEALREANKIVFGMDGIPSYHIDKADFLISIGTNFLETWVSNVKFAREFSVFHEPKNGKKNLFVYIGPRLSMTAANADQWIMAPFGSESAVALGLLRLVLVKLPESRFPPSVNLAGGRASLLSAIAQFTPDAVEKATGVKAALLEALAGQLTRAEQPLILAEGMGYQDPNAFDTAVAANLICSLFPRSIKAIDFSSPSALSGVVRLERMKSLTEAALNGEIDLLLIDRANPTFHLPASWQWEKALRAVSLVVSFSSFPDETSEFAHLVLPTNTFLESWGDYSPCDGVHGLMQPIMGRIFDTNQLGDILLSTGRKIKPETFPEKDMYEILRSAWGRKTKEFASAGNPEEFWQESLCRGGFWEASEKKSPVQSRSVTTALPFSGRKLSSDPTKGLGFIVYPTIQFFDGRMANRPFLQEMPDPVTQVTWTGWVEINPETARKLSIEKGDLLTIRTEHGSVKGVAYPYFGIAPDMLAMPVGHGHSAFGRYARSETTNMFQLVSGQLDPAGGVVWPVVAVIVEKDGRAIGVAHTDGSPYEHGRDIIQSITLKQYQSKTWSTPEITLPLPQNWDTRIDFYPSHKHINYRWAMVVDLDRCIGCGACTIGCYTENNVGIVGRRNVEKGRHMAWLQHSALLRT